MLEEENQISKFYYPCCREKGCDGLLRIKLNDNFTLDYECDKNKEHIGQNIFFKTFEMYFLKEKVINKCSKCYSNIENDYQYYCKKCELLYCPNCFSFDKHIKEDFNNLVVRNKKCIIHKKEITSYCITCKKYLCNSCIINYENISHKKHKVQNFYGIMPSNYLIDNLKKKIEENLKFYERVTISIEMWHKRINDKIEELKQNFKKEIHFCKTLLLNFNQYFINFTYYYNFYQLSKYIKRNYNKYLQKLENCYNFEEQTKALMNYFFPNNNEPKILEDKSYNCVRNEVVNYRINNKYFFQINRNLKKVKLMEYNLKNNYFQSVYNLSTDLNGEVYSISSSAKKNQIYVCLSETLKVLIFNYDIKEQTIMLNEDIIIDDQSDKNYQFHKCISISQNYLATSDNNSICIWSNYNSITNNTEKYTKIKRIELSEKVTDLLLINNEYFISAHPASNKIAFYAINNLEQEKIITQINVSNRKDSLLLFKEYTIINCMYGIAVIMNKIKEYIQYIKKNYDKDYFYTIINVYDDNSIYLTYLNIDLDDKEKYRRKYIIFIKIYGYKIISGLLDKYKEYDEIKIKIINNDDINNNDIINKFELLCWDENNFLITGNEEYHFITEDYNNDSDKKSSDDNIMIEDYDDDDED